MRLIFIFIITPILFACSAMPSKNYAIIKEQESSAYNTTLEAKKSGSSIQVTPEKSKISFSKNSPLVKASNSLAPFNKFSFEKKNESEKYLVFSAKNHVIGYLKNGYIVPEIEFFDNDGKKLKSVLAQFGEEASCQIGRCLVTTFDVSNFPPGKITGIVMAKSDGTDKPFLSKTEDMNQFTNGVYLHQTFTVDIYADFFGDAEVYLSNQRPLSSEIGGNTIFYQK